VKWCKRKQNIHSWRERNTVTYKEGDLSLIIRMYEKKRWMNMDKIRKNKDGWEKMARKKHARRWG